MVERGAQGSGDGAHVIAPVQTDVRWTERAVLAVVVRQCRGKVLAACSREVADLSTTLLTIDRWIGSST